MRDEKNKTSSISKVDSKVQLMTDDLSLKTAIQFDFPKSSFQTEIL
jgi:hypothetical protein